jgi:mannose-6-phosphate isomerase-like protein (cupin superfamily)
MNEEDVDMNRGTIIKALKVAPFALPGDESLYQSRMLIDRSNSESEKLQINHFTLHPGCRTAGGIHKAPYDEVYYVLEGMALLHLDDQVHEIECNDLVFIPGGTFHSLDNKSDTRLKDTILGQIIYAVFSGYRLPGEHLVPCHT